jgi:hypothetical protein
MMQELGQAKICNMGFKVGVQKNIVGFHVAMKDKRATIMVKIAQPLGSLHCNFVSVIPIQMPSIVSMKQLSQASIRHVFIHQKISVMVGAKRQQSNYVPMADFAQSLDLCRETMII